MTNPLGIGQRVTGGMGRANLLALIDEINHARAQRGIRERYKPDEVGGILTMADDPLPFHLKANSPSPRYANAMLEAGENR